MIKENKKAGRSEYIIIILVTGLILIGISGIVRSLENIYGLYESSFQGLYIIIFWGITLIFSFIIGFFFIILWLIIKKYFSVVVE